MSGMISIIGQKIVNSVILDRDEAEIVFQDLMCLQLKGKWSIPQWAVDVSQHYNYEGREAHPAVQITAWEAIAKGFRNACKEQSK